MIASIEWIQQLPHLSNQCFLFCFQEHNQSKLAASQCGARTPLSPVTQATIQKHLPGLPTRRLLMQQAYSSAAASQLQHNKVEKRDVSCCTGKTVVIKVVVKKAIVEVRPNCVEISSVVFQRDTNE